MAREQMDEITLVAIVGAVLAAVIAWMVQRFFPTLERILTRPDPVVTHIEAPSDLPPPRIDFETDPAVFESGMPNWDGYGYIFAKSPGELDPPPGDICREWRGWARALGGIDAEATKVQVVVEGKSPGEVVIDALEIEVSNRAEPPTGVKALCQAGGASASPREILIDLDADPPKIEYLAPGGDPVESFLFTLQQGETETFRLYAFTQAHYCEWTARLSLIANGERQAIEINDAGGPFRTAAGSRAIPHVWDGANWAAA